MTTAPTDYAHQDFYASQHPIRRFVAALVLAVAVLALLWWTGLLAPRLSTEGSSGQFDLATQMGVLDVEVRNESPTPVRIKDAGLLSGATVQGVSIDGQTLDRAPQIAGGSTSILRLEYRSDACLAEPPGNVIGLRLDVRTVAGLTKTQRLYSSVPTSTPSTSC